MRARSARTCSLSTSVLARPARTGTCTHVVGTKSLRAPCPSRSGPSPLKAHSSRHPPFLNVLARTGGLKEQRPRKEFCADKLSHGERTSPLPIPPNSASTIPNPRTSRLWPVCNGWGTGSTSCPSGLATQIRARSATNVLAQTCNLAGLLSSG